MPLDLEMHFIPDSQSTYESASGSNARRTTDSTPFQPYQRSSRNQMERRFELTTDRDDPPGKPPQCRKRRGERDLLSVATSMTIPRPSS